MGGLAAAIMLRSEGYDVTVLDQWPGPGGKARIVEVAGKGVDAGPTVLTMRWVFEQLFEALGESLSAHVELRPIKILARHAWRDGGQLDLFSDIEQSVEAIAALAGNKDADGFRRFCRDSAEIHQILLPAFICDQRPTLFTLLRRIGLVNPDVFKLRPYSTLWSSLHRYFSDPRLLQLFGRYATYCGSSPMRSPATLMLVAHTEQQGVWSVKGGTAALVQALADLAKSKGVIFRYGCKAEKIETKSGKVSGVMLADGNHLIADKVVFNGDIQALGTLIGEGAGRTGVKTHKPSKRSLSAMTWCMQGRAAGFPLEMHNVFFARNYANEFQAIFKNRSIPDVPTVYVCAQDRGAFGRVTEGEKERMLVIINAPADGDRVSLPDDERARIGKRVLSFLSECGLEITADDGDISLTTPHEFNQLFPASGGALYGRTTHGPYASFARPGATTSISGLYLAGGSVHPGPGLPMAAISGQLVAAKITADQPKNFRVGGA